MTLLRELRASGSAAHVLVVTAKDTLEDRLAGLNLGADDYLVKPFALAELLARIRALIRRKYRAKSAGDPASTTSKSTQRIRRFAGRAGTSN